MNLKRYVKVENGMVYDMDKIRTVVVCFTEENGQHTKVYAQGDNYPDGKRVMDFEQVILATSDDIFELVRHDWLAIIGKSKYPFEAQSFCTFSNKRHLPSPEDRAWMKEEITALYCPITENGTVRRYELVWER